MIANKESEFKNIIPPHLQRRYGTRRSVVNIAEYAKKKKKNLKGDNLEIMSYRKCLIKKTK